MIYKSRHFFGLLAALLFFAALSPLSFASELKEPDGGIIGIANRGEHHENPENSLAAIAAAAKTGIDAVLADVSLTSDSAAVLLEAGSAARMLDGAEKERTADYTLEEIRGFFLKNGSGGKNNTASNLHPATLAEALDAANEKNIVLVLKTDAKNAEAVAELLGENSGHIIYLTGEAKTVKAALAKLGNAYNVITEKRGNVIFAQTSFVDFSNENGGEAVVLKTTNRYGVNFNQTLLRHFYGKSRAAADTSDPTLAGAREDAEKWWDDLVSRGYSVIITNDPQGFADYKKANEAAREKLSSAYNKYTSDWQLPQFGSFIFNDYKKAYTDAVSTAKTLLADNSSSTQAMNDCFAALTKACDDIDLNFEALETGKAGMTVSAPRIGLCIGAAAVVIAVQIFFFKRREKV